MKINTSILKTFVYGGTASLLAVTFMIFPNEAFEASLQGLEIWWYVVFPSLLPFFIIAEFLIHFGVVSFIGTLLEPIMRPVFRVPGIGGFVWAMGLASGFPAGAKLTARMREEKKITATEGERLVSFTNASNPLFIFGAVSVGFFHNPNLGVILAAAHYIGNVLVGILMRFHKGRDERKDDQNRNVKLERFSLKQALKRMHNERLKYSRPFGKMMGDAVQSSIQTLLMVGGFIILFSVLNEILRIVNIATIFSSVISIILRFLQMTEQLSPAIISGLFEITTGSQMVSKTNTTLLDQAIITSFILAFNGFSVQAQVASILASTDIRFQPFFFARCIHGVISAILAYFFFHFLYVDSWQTNEGNVAPVFALETIKNLFIDYYHLLLHWGGLFTIFCLISWIIWLAYQYLHK